MNTNEKDLFQIRKNLTAIAIFILIIVLIIDILVRYSPESIGLPPFKGNTLSAVGYHQQASDGSSWEIYTIFENNGNVYQCWNDGKSWNQKKVTNFKTISVPEEK